MKLIILFLTRKALVLTLSLISMGLGLIALYFLPIQLYPSSSENSKLITLKFDFFFFIKYTPNNLLVVN